MNPYLKLFIRMSASISGDIDQWSSTYIHGTIRADEDGIMFTSIPYDTGWTVKVDGEKVTPESIDGTLMYIQPECR